MSNAFYFISLSNLKDYYASPIFSPINFLSVKQIDANATNVDGLTAYAYRQYIYKSSDYDVSKRLKTGTEEEVENNLSTPATFSGSYIDYGSGLNYSKSVSVDDGIYVIEYVVLVTRYLNDGSTVVSIRLDSYVYPALAVATNREALFPYTITEVIVRCCELMEALRLDDGVWQKPRFRLQGVIYDSYGNGGMRKIA